MGQTGSTTAEPEAEVTGQTDDMEKGQTSSKPAKTSKQSKKQPKMKTDTPKIEQVNCMKNIDLVTYF